MRYLLVQPLLEMVYTSCWDGQQTWRTSMVSITHLRLPTYSMDFKWWNNTDFVEAVHLTSKIPRSFKISEVKGWLLPRMRYVICGGFLGVVTWRICWFCSRWCSGSSGLDSWWRDTSGPRPFIQVICLPVALSLSLYLVHRNFLILEWVGIQLLIR